MRRRKIACFSVLLAVQAIGLSLVSRRGEAGPDPLAEGLAHCARIAATDARLACYDGLARESTRESGPAVVAAPVVAAPLATSTSASASSGPAPAADAAQNFGFSPARINPKPPGPAAIEARLSGIATNQGDFGQTTLRLDNGEVWKTRDDVSRLAVGDPVRIKRAALGSYLLLDPANLSYRVYRLK